jgi:hypothetical protein
MMISPGTPPGADVICIDDTPGPYGAGGLSRGAIYTVDRIEPCVTGGYGVFLREVSPWDSYAPPWGLVTIGFELKRFRYLEIHKSLTAMLSQPVVHEMN